MNLTVESGSVKEFVTTSMEANALVGSSIVCCNSMAGILSIYLF